jgi:hypothetical protein
LDGLLAMFAVRPVRCAFCWRRYYWFALPLMHLVVTLIVVGVLLWLVNRFIPMQSSIKSILNGVVVICVVL